MPEEIRWSPKQFGLVAMRETIAETRVIVPGPVRSGKTEAASYGWHRYNCLTFSGYTFALAAHTQRQFDNVVLPAVRRFARMNGMPVRKDGIDLLLPSWVGSQPNRFVRLLGSHEHIDAEKALGMTFAGGFLDEAPILPLDFVKAIEERCSVEGSKIVFTGNPLGPNHPIKRDYIDRCDDPADDFDGVHIPFELKDNPSLTDRYIAQLYDTYTGVNRERKIFGRWVAEEGVIYPDFEKNVRRPPDGEEPWRLEVAIDHAESSVTAAGLYGRFASATWKIAEWRHDGREAGQMANAAQAVSILDAFAPYGHIAAWVVDPTAQDFRAALQAELNARRHGTSAEGGYNQVADGIEAVRAWFREGRLFISPDCEHSVAGLSAYRWDPNAAKRGADRPLKVDDHEADETRYYVMQRHIAERGAVNLEVLDQGVLV